MAVIVVLSNGRRLQINGRHERIIEAIAENAPEWSKFTKGQLTFHFAGKNVRCEITPKPDAIDLPPADD